MKSNNVDFSQILNHLVEETEENRPKKEEDRKEKEGKLGNKKGRLID